MVIEIEDIISTEKIQNELNKLRSKGKLSTVYKEKPTMFLLDLPKGYDSEDEVHENEDDFYVILEGEGELTINNKINFVKKGDLIHIPAKIIHKIKTDKGIAYIVVKIKNEN